MKKIWLIWLGLVISLLLTTYFSRHYLLGNPLSRAYGKLALGTEKSEAEKIIQKYYPHYPADQPYLTPGTLGADEVYLQWQWDGDSFIWIRKLLPIATDYEEHAYLDIQFRDEKVINATYGYYRYAYPDRPDDYRTRGFYYSKTECLIPDANCPSEKKYINLRP